MSNIADKLIVALDVDTLEQATRFVDTLLPVVRLFKIGGQLFTACGPEAVRMVGERGCRVFLDLKFHDIPHTVFCSAGSGTICAHVVAADRAEEGKEPDKSLRPPVFMMTVHTAGGEEMMKEAVRGARSRAQQLHVEPPLIVGVTKLTSDKADEDTPALVLERARLARASGLSGVVCSVHEAAAVRAACGRDFVIVTPGIRPQGADAGDQKRVATAQAAFAAGADYIVVGRPILEAADPLAAARELIH